MNRVLKFVGRVAADPRPDRALLAAVAADRGDPALAELFRRHAAADHTTENGPDHRDRVAPDSHLVAAAVLDVAEQLHLQFLDDFEKGGCSIVALGGVPLLLEVRAVCETRYVLRARLVDQVVDEGIRPTLPSGSFRWMK